ncbi:MAG: hypothetical protein HXY28_10695 [Hydrogenophilaceae bacterium]|jgi:hypothetical protein|nr:hypothetical protein [Hydrogenophilaceae bacterium]
MRKVFAALAIVFLGAAPAFAGDFECVWRNMPTDVRAAFTRNTVTSEDINTVLNSGVLTEPILVAAMQPCAIEDSEATQLGQYVAARALALAQRSRLITQHGWHESQFIVLMAPVTADEREAVWRSASGDQGVDTSSVAMRFRTSAQGQGLTDEAALRSAMEFMYAQVVVERLAPAMRP